MDLPHSVATIGLLAFGIAVILMPVLRRLLVRVNLFDEPNHRSSHEKVTLRGAGLGVVVATVAVFPLIGSASPSALVLYAAVVGSGLIGFVDDLRDLTARFRLIAQIAIGVLIVASIIPDPAQSPVLSIGFAVLGVAVVVGLTNVVNFMDGINGITCVTAVIVCSYYCALGLQSDLPVVAGLAIASAGAMLAVLPWNFPVARMFLGDVGSYFVGSVIAALGLKLIWAGVSPVAVVAPLAFYGADTSFTLLLRWRRGASLMSSHREHRYQLLARDIGHTWTTVLVASFTMTATGLGWMASSASIVGQLSLGLGLALLAVLYLMLPALTTVRPAATQPASSGASAVRPVSSNAPAIRPAKGRYLEPAVTAAPTDSIAASTSVRE